LRPHSRFNQWLRAHVARFSAKAVQGPSPTGAIAAAASRQLLAAQARGGGTSMRAGGSVIHVTLDRFDTASAMGVVM